MSRTRTPHRQGTSPAATSAARSRAIDPADVRWTFVLVVVLLVVTPLVVTPGTRESFRTIKGLLAGWIGIASLAVAAWGLGRVAMIDWSRLWRRPIVRALLPLALVVSAGWLWTRHPDHFREAWIDFAIGVACAIAWSLALPARLLGRALVWSTAVSALVAALTLDQAWHIVGVLDGLGVVARTERLALTSTLGNPGDVGASLVLPLLFLAWSLPSAERRRRPALVAIAIVIATGLLVTTTLAAIVAAVAGGAVLAWLLAGDRRPSATRRWPAWVAAVTALLCLATLVGPVRVRVLRVTEAARSGDWNTVLTGRLDGWRVARELMRTDPLAGVGQGAFRAEFADARLRLMDRGVPFYREQPQVMFATPHNEYLSVAAEQGWPGLMALLWGIGCIGLACWRVPDRRDRAFAMAGLAALALLSLAWFPMHVAAVAWPWLLWLAWVDRVTMEAES